MDLIADIHIELPDVGGAWRRHAHARLVTAAAAAEQLGSEGHHRSGELLARHLEDVWLRHDPLVRHGRPRLLGVLLKGRSLLDHLRRADHLVVLCDL